SLTLNDLKELNKQQMRDNLDPTRKLSNGSYLQGLSDLGKEFTPTPDFILRCEIENFVREARWPLKVYNTLFIINNILIILMIVIKSSVYFLKGLYFQL